MTAADAQKKPTLTLTLQGERLLLGDLLVLTHLARALELTPDTTRVEASYRSIAITAWVDDVLLPAD